MITRFFDKTVIIKRLSTVSGYKKTYQSVATVETHMQGLNKDAKQRLDIVADHAWLAWFELDADIQKGDQLINADGTRFEVLEVLDRDYGINQHKEVTLTELNA